MSPLLPTRLPLGEGAPVQRCSFIQLAGRLGDLEARGAGNHPLSLSSSGVIAFDIIKAKRVTQPESSVSLKRG